MKTVTFFYLLRAAKSRKTYWPAEAFGAVKWQEVQGMERDGDKDEDEGGGKRKNEN